MLPLLLDLRMIGDNIGMAEEAFLHGRDPGIPRPVYKRMTEPAIDLLYSRMDAMAEKNRLLRAEVAFGVIIIKIDHPGKDKSQDPEPCKPALCFDRLLFHQSP